MQPQKFQTDTWDKTHWGRDKIAVADYIFKCIFLNENVSIYLNISPKFVPTVWINNISALV